MRGTTVDLLQEAMEVSGSIARVITFAVYARDHVEGEEERVRPENPAASGARLSLHRRQSRPRGIKGQQGPIRIFFSRSLGVHTLVVVDTEHHRPVRRRQIEPDYAAHLFHEQGTCGEFEHLPGARVHAKSPPQALDRCLRQSGLFGHCVHRPVGCAGRLRVERPIDDLGRLSTRHGIAQVHPRPAQQSLDPEFEKALAPFAERGWRHIELCRDRLVGQTVGAAQDNPATIRYRARAAAATNKHFQGKPFVFIQP